jgi:aminoglycoside phosphotransferase family enzyme
MEGTSRSSQNEVKRFLSTEKAYPHRVSRIQVIQTHISWVFLTGRYAYKVKRQLKFGKILDFSTLALRRRYCEKEVALNKLLCGNMYIGVLKIVKASSGDARFKLTDLHDKRKAVEYCVKMKEIPQKFQMDNLLKADKVDEDAIKRLASTLARFHRSTPTNSKIQRFGQPDFMKAKIDENFETISSMHISIDPKYHIKMNSFINKNRRLFFNRIKAGKIRDIHGDLYLGNIFIVGNRFYLYDRIEFNDNLRYADVAEDVAHLAMDLDSHNRHDLQEFFVNQYILKSKDNTLKDILYFMMCFKACMRAKVSFFNAMSAFTSERNATAMGEGNRLLEVAESYLKLF